MIKRIKYFYNKYCKPIMFVSAIINIVKFIVTIVLYIF